MEQIPPDSMMRQSRPGFLFLSLGLILIGFLIYYIAKTLPDEPLTKQLSILEEQHSVAYTEALLVMLAIERWIPAIILFILTLISLLLAYKFFKSSGLFASSIVPLRDRDLVLEAIQRGQSEPIDQYIRLSSLSGFVGLFTKVGLTGLPLATILLVIFFSVISWVEAPNGSNPGSEAFKAFLDLTKLTLGAFIGSYVQRTVERRSQEQELLKVLKDAATKTP